MLNLSRTQEQTLDEAAQRQWLARLRQLAAGLNKDGASGGELTGLLEKVRTRGHTLGLVSERGIAALLCCMVLLGAEFAQTHPWAAEILSDLGNGTPDERAELLLQAACQEYGLDEAAILGELRAFSSGAPAGAYERSAIGHAGLQLQKLQFEGGISLKADGGDAYSGPHWSLRRQEQHHPVAYLGGSPLSIALSLHVDPLPQQAEQVVMTARTSGGLCLSGRCRVTPQSTTVELTVTGAELPEPAQAYEPFVIEWYVEVAGLAPQLLTRTAHPLYLLASTAAEPPLSWTHVHLSCQAAGGCTTSDELVARAAAAMASGHAWRCTDGAELLRDDSMPDDGEPADPLALTADLSGAVHCSPGAWARLWREALAAQGISMARNEPA